MKKFICTCIFIFSFVSLLSAQKNISYKFTVENKIILDSTTGLYEGENLEFRYRRIYLADSIFKEEKLFGKSNDNTDVFKVSNGCWYVKVNGKWVLFYSIKEKVVPRIKIEGYWFYFKPIDRQMFRGGKCMVYEACPVNYNAGETLRYWFSVTAGIVKIETSEVSLIREKVL
ncbi:hypothetical protein [Chitinophaga sancti]|nr:hypothetical protein [Chitinophaga sancti]WQD64444.1 hypothetical protein U0033_08550 [Chitinophaga sancti]WQG89932.1 hypothetical protein SR876_00370 [Chitinophaga sancti]